MSNKKIRFNVIDVFIFIILVFVILGAVIRNTNISDFNMNNTVTDAVLTIGADSIDSEIFGHFKVGDTLYADFDDEAVRLGKIRKIDFTPTVVPQLEGDSVVYVPDSRYIDVTIEIETVLISDENGFNILDGNYITPGLLFSANNGRVKFDCSVQTVKLLP